MGRGCQKVLKTQPSREDCTLLEALIFWTSEKKSTLWSQNEMPGMPVLEQRADTRDFLKGRKLKNSV